MSKKLAIAMFGQKRLSREGGVEIVVKELCTRMAQNGCDVTCYNRAGHHVSGAEYDDAGKTEYEGIRQKSVPTIERRGLAAVSSSFFAALYSAFGKYDVVHIHAEGPAFFCWLPKLFGKRVVVTIHGIDWQREKWQSGLGSKFIHQGEKNAAKYADEVIVLSKGVQDYFKETYGRETHFIPNGVNRPQTREASLIRVNVLLNFFSIPIQNIIMGMGYNNAGTIFSQYTGGANAEISYIILLMENGIAGFISWFVALMSIYNKKMCRTFNGIKYSGLVHGIP